MRNTYYRRFSYFLSRIFRPLYTPCNYHVVQSAVFSMAGANGLALEEVRSYI